MKVNEQVLYQARIDLPSNVTTGRYTAETFAITRGRVVASATARIEVGTAFHQSSHLGILPILAPL